jgi:hypothetical protein
LFAESIPAMFGERVGPLPVSFVSSTTEPSDGVILLRFWNQGTISDGYSLGDDVMKWGRVRFNRSLFVDYHFREFRKWEILHELFHVAFATHLTDENHARFPHSAMSAELVQQLSAADRLASWIVYRDGTAPGNRAPDVNPTYAELGPAGISSAGAMPGGARVILPSAR